MENELEFETVSNDNAPDVKEASINVNDLFSGFPSPKIETPVTSENDTKIPETESGREIWEGNPLYFQSGLKAGQLKPSAGGVSSPKSHKAKAQAAPEPPPPPKGMLVSGKMLMSLTDIVLPFLIAGGHNFQAKTEADKISRIDLKFTPDQKSEFSDVFNECAEYLKLYLPPVAVLATVVGGAYTANYAKTIANKKKVKPESPE